MLLKALLATPPIDSPARSSSSSAKGFDRTIFLRATNIPLFEGAQKIPGLEVDLGPEMSIHILLPGLLLDGLQKIIREFQPGSPSSQPH
jgi:hypothetical protein